jgi:hypothetical protein
MISVATAIQEMSQQYTERLWFLEKWKNINITTHIMQWQI